MAAPRTFWQKLWLFFSIVVVNLLVRLFTRVEIEGQKNIPLGGGVLLVSNHISALDVLLVPMACMTRWPLTPLEFVTAPAKEKFFDIPVIGTIIKSWGAFPIHHSGRDLKSLSRIVETMNNEKMMLFPEGTRSPDGNLQPGMRTAGWLIHQAKPTVIPTAVFGTDMVWPRDKILPRPYGRVKVVFGKPLNLDRYYNSPSSKEAAQQLVDEVMAAIAHLRDVHRPAWDTSP
jgi:1-acyl-sn-glycerol-3-phosphate acyltransferase